MYVRQDFAYNSAKASAIAIEAANAKGASIILCSIRLGAMRLALLLVALPMLLDPSAVLAQQQRSPVVQGPLIDYETVLYSQPRLIDEVMAGILPSDKVAPNTYFLGFAAWSAQDVFIREIAQARDIVDDRLGTRERSLLLVNHVTALEEVPLASVTNLDIVLGRLGRIMDVEKDTLILFLTSHGIENVFGVQFPGFPLNHLTPPRLLEMLDRSGIRNRIIIISACHSGSFLPTLRQARTMIMTAARADRASFGCSNENDWTYFGNALFNHALRSTTSLQQAFVDARQLITGWEAKEKFVPSEPQIFVGDGITSVLDRLAALSVPTGTSAAAYAKARSAGQILTGSVDKKSKRVQSKD